MPAPVDSGVRELSRRRARHFDTGNVVAPVLSVDEASAFDLRGEFVVECRRKDRRSVAIPLSLTDDDLSSPGIEVLDAQAETFEQAEPGAVEQAADQRVLALEFAEDGAELLSREYDGEAPRNSRPDSAVEADELSTEHLSVPSTSL